MGATLIEHGVRLSPVEHRAVQAFLLASSLLRQAGQKHDRYTDLDHALWEAAAQGLYGEGWEQAPGWDGAKVRERELLLRQIGAGF